MKVETLRREEKVMIFCAVLQGVCASSRLSVEPTKDEVRKTIGAAYGLAEEAFKAGGYLLTEAP
jgi:hypothetical protein